MQIDGNFNLVLHSHLPWVINHGNWPHGEDWLMEAIAECYLPIIEITQNLIDKGISPKYTIGFSPVLAEQLSHPSIQNKFIKYCNHKIEAARINEIAFINNEFDQQKVYLAGYWQRFYKEAIQKLEACNWNVLTKFKEFQDQNHIEIITCGLTHGYMPLIGSDSHVEFQIKSAVHNYQKHFGKNPNGIWLPECAYRPAYEWRSYIPIKPFNQANYRFGVEELLDKYNLNFFFTDEAVLKKSVNNGDFTNNPTTGLNPSNIYNVESKYPKSGGSTSVFTRNLNLSMKVWSGEVGYPGEAYYLDFHKKEDDSKLRYWRVTDIKIDMGEKQLYNPEWIWEKVDKQSHDFIKQIERVAHLQKSYTGKIATVCTPFDTELFGHWWFEGPKFLEKLFEGIDQSPSIGLATCSEQMHHHSGEHINLSEGSWGKNNDHTVWMNDLNKWCWEVCYNAEKKLLDLKSKFMHKKFKNKLSESIFKQAVISLQLILSSDWQFLIETDSATDYSEMRMSNHYSDFLRLINYLYKVENGLELDNSEKEDIVAIQSRDDLFNEISSSSYIEI